ncbi:MAG TPA: low-specificity L-threonine aldolase [bacterium]|jgi:threonine aldolase|nr:low-specificity L-threonine aldolase [bacterium]HOX85991.1 low-specificity L-threonine aldolase [bacterium]HPG45026.1 low-specificity L-threonine aldolase [bacterium]HPM97268.1 low-specificity L-threonine aldolase [bacterium]
MQWVDLRSDTVTQPTAAMREAIFTAKVGDDVYGEDPTVNALQQTVADLFGKEMALFVPSGTMSNQIAIKSHTEPGDEVICEQDCHCFNYEGGGPALLSGVQMRPLPGRRGMIAVEQIENALRMPNDHFPHSRLITLENTHNRAGGTIFPIDEMELIALFARQHKLAVHLDGARIFNAHISSGVPLRRYGDCVDSISICLSKGLGAPVGSVLVGSSQFIQRAHRFRKIFGGGMRQAGILAAAGLYALQNHVERLREDHQRARLLAETFAAVEGAAVDLESVQTNIVIVDFSAGRWTAPQAVTILQEEGVLASAFSTTRLRLVTHLNLTDLQIDKTVETIKRRFK